MKPTSWAFLGVLGSALFLVLILKDWETKQGVDRLSHFRMERASKPTPVKTAE